MPRTKKVTSEKDMKTVATVDKLLEGIELKTTDKKKITDKFNKIKQDKESNWETQQLDAVTAENEKLKSEISKLTTQLNEKKQEVPQQQVAQGGGMNLQQKNAIKKLLMELENNMSGRNQERRRYPDVKTAYMLKKLKSIFTNIV